VAELLGLPGDYDLAANLCIVRINLPGGAHADKAVPPEQAAIGRNAMCALLYGNLFDHVMTYVNAHTGDHEESDGFIGLLDYSNFETIAKNSLYQLCNNYTCETFHCLYNEVTDAGLMDNTPCINMLAKKNKKFQGLLPMLDDMSTNSRNTDEKFVSAMSSKLGKQKGMNLKIKTAMQRQASEFYYQDPKKDYIFYVCHYAGDLRYDARGLLAKNNAQAPNQFLSKEDFPSAEGLVGQLLASDRKTSRFCGKKTFRTAAARALYEHGGLLKTLRSTSCRWTWCIKPNDKSMKPTAGPDAFDEWKVYRQLKRHGACKK